MIESFAGKYVKAKGLKDGCPGLKPSEVHTMVTSLNAYADRLKQMYDLTEKTTKDVSENAIRKAKKSRERKNNPPPPDSPLVKPKSTPWYKKASDEEVQYEKMKKQREEKKETEEKEDKAYDKVINAEKKYSEKMIKLDDNPDLKGAAEEFIGNYSDKITEMETVLYSDAKFDFISLIIEINQYIEQAKQVREYKRAHSSATDNADVNNATQEDHIYTYGDDNSFVSSNNLDATMDELKNKQKLTSKEKDKLEHLEHIKAENDLEEAFKTRKVPETMNASMLRAYLDFNPDAYDASLKKAGNDEGALKKVSSTREAAAAGAMKDLMRASEEESDEEEDDGFEVPDIIGEINDYAQTFTGNVMPIIAELSKVSENVDDFMEIYADDIPDDLVQEKGKVFTSIEGEGEQIDMTAMKKQLNWAGALECINTFMAGAQTVLDFLAIFQSHGDAMQALQKGDIAESNMKKLETVLNIMKVLNGIATTVSSGGKAVISFVVAAGNTAKPLFQAFQTFSSIGDITGVVGGAIDIVSGVSQAIYHGHAAHRATKAKRKIRDLKAANSEQFARFMKQYSLAEKEQAWEGGVDAVKGTVSTAMAIASIAAAPAALVTGGVGLACFAASLAAKKIIQSVFKGKKNEAAFRDLIGEGKYNNIMDRMGGKSSERFHNVLRRTTGIPTRTGYRQALNVTDAIDLYTAAHAYNALNPGGNPVNNEQQVIKTAMGGLGYSDPKKYGNIKLEDILGKVQESGNWKGTLTAAITQNQHMNDKEDISLKAAKKSDAGNTQIPLPKKDQKPKLKHKKGAAVV